MPKIIIFLILSITVSLESKIKPFHVLKNIKDLKVEENRSIFFLDTTIVSDNFTRVQMKHRTACSVESAADKHKNRTVYLLYTTPGYVHAQDLTKKYFRVLLRRDNVRIAYVNITDLARKTPVEELLLEKKIESSKYKIIHYSDLLRLLVLWRYGGVYLDNDVLVLRSLEGLSRNFVGLQDDNLVENCVLGFHGKIFREAYVGGVLLSKFRDRYEGNSWDANGPGLLTSFVRRLFDTEELPQTIDKIFHGLRIYPRQYFCPIPWDDWKHFFDEFHTKTVLERTQNSYAVHFWNKHSKAKMVLADRDVPYVLYAKKYCPDVMEVISKWF